jgi:hypothetical protein
MSTCITEGCLRRPGRGLCLKISEYLPVIREVGIYRKNVALALQRPGVAEFLTARAWLKPADQPCQMAPYLLNTLDKGEASVIQTAIDRQVQRVAIDEAVGRRIARLANLKVTGSLGILVKARQQGLIGPMTDCLQRLDAHGIWLTAELRTWALTQEARISAAP